MSNILEQDAEEKMKNDLIEYITGVTKELMPGILDGEFDPVSGASRYLLEDILGINHTPYVIRVEEQKDIDS